MKNQRARGITKDGKPIFNEDHEHIIVADWLNAKGIMFIHTPNEGRRSWATGKKLKRMGMRKGVPDFLIFDKPMVFAPGAALELKALDGARPSEEQLGFLDRLDERGWLIHWCRGADAAIEWLESLGY